MLSVVSFIRLTAMKNTQFSSLYCVMHNFTLVNKGSALRSSLDTKKMMKKNFIYLQLADLCTLVVGVT